MPQVLEVSFLDALLCGRDQSLEKSLVRAEAATQEITDNWLHKIW
jgi:hypothetical protein